MEQFDYNKYLKNNPLLKEGDMPTRQLTGDDDADWMGEVIGQDNDYKKAALEIVALAKNIIKSAEEQLSMRKEISYASKLTNADQLSDLYYHLLDELGDFVPKGMDPFRKGAKKIIVDKYNIEMTDEYGRKMTWRLEGGSTSMNEAKNKEKDIEIDIDSAEQITLKGKELDSDKLGTNKKYRDLILKAPDKAFMYKGKPASITAVDLNDGSVDEPKIYLTIINESKINEAFAANSKLANALNFLKRNADNIIEDNPEIASALEAVKASGLTSRDVFTFASLFPRDSFKIDDIRTGKLEAQVNRVYFDGSDMLNKAKALRLFLLAFDNYHYGDKNWYKGY